MTVSPLATAVRGKWRGVWHDLPVADGDVADVGEALEGEAELAGRASVDRERQLTGVVPAVVPRRDLNPRGKARAGVRAMAERQRRGTAI